MRAIFPKASPDVTITADMVIVEQVAALNQPQGPYLHSLLQRLKNAEEAHLNCHGQPGEGSRKVTSIAMPTVRESVILKTFERAAGLFRSLGGRTYGAIHAPSATGLPQLGTAELDSDVS